MIFIERRLLMMTKHISSIIAFVILVITISACNQMNTKELLQNEKSAELLNGKDINGIFKKLAGHDSSYEEVDEKITSVKRSFENDRNKEELLISNADSDYPIYAWYEENLLGDGIIYYWSEAGTIKLNQDASYMFSSFQELESIDVTGFDTSNVTDMNNMFANCYKLKAVDFSNFDTSNVQDMSYMFLACYGMKEIDLCCFNTSAVINMSHMFDDCENVTHIDISKFDTSSVTDMSGMFCYCYRLKDISVESLNTANVTSMNMMFYGCSSLSELDLSSFDFSKTVSVSGMFENCSSLKSISGIENADMSHVKKMTALFSGCKMLKADCSNWNVNNISDKQSYANFNNGAPEVIKPAWK